MTLLQAIDQRITELELDPSRSIPVEMSIDTFDSLLAPSTEIPAHSIRIRMANIPFGMFRINSKHLTTQIVCKS